MAVSQHASRERITPLAPPQRAKSRASSGHHRGAAYCLPRPQLGVVMTSAAGIAKALSGRKVGNCWIARCPAHDDNTPSLSIRDANNGTVLVRCHAGCEQTDVIAALRSRKLWPEKGASRFRYPARVI